MSKEYVKIKHYTKILIENDIAIVAIYEPHPFRNCAIAEAIETTDI